jgi:hypothetical protein
MPVGAFYGQEAVSPEGASRNQETEMLRLKALSLLVRGSSILEHDFFVSTFHGLGSV